MRCRTARKLLSRRIDVALSGVDAAALESHLVACAGCRLAAAGLDRAWHALDALGGAISAPDDWARIEAAAEARSRGWMPSWLRWDLMPAPAAAGVLAAMVALKTTGGFLLSRAALAPRRSEPLSEQAAPPGAGPQRVGRRAVDERGACGGVAVGELAERGEVPMESRVFAETLGDLPWGSPATGLARALDTGPSHEEEP